MVAEPGFYADGRFGIRIENVVIVQKAATPNKFGDRDYLTFEHFTMVRRASFPPQPLLNYPQCPIQTSLVHVSLLSKAERKWLNDYNAEVEAKVLPLLEKKGDERAISWLKRQCVAV